MLLTDVWASNDYDASYACMKPGVLRSGIMCPGVMCSGVMRPGVMRSGVMRPGVMGPGVMRPGVMCPGVMRPGVMRPGVTRCLVVTTKYRCSAFANTKLTLGVQLELYVSKYNEISYNWPVSIWVLYNYLKQLPKTYLKLPKTYLQLPKTTWEAKYFGQYCTKIKCLELLSASVAVVIRRHICE